MDFGAVTVLVGGAIGLALAVFGARIIVTGRAPAATARSFRDLRDAGRYHLLFGVALLMLAVGTTLPGDIPGVVAAFIGVVLVGVAVVRHRPRGRTAQEQDQDQAQAGEREQAVPSHE